MSEIVGRAQTGESARSLALELDVANSALTRMLRGPGVTIQKRKVSLDEERAMALAYEAGSSMAEIEKQFMVSHGAVLRVLHRSGVEMRAKAPRKRTLR